MSTLSIKHIFGIDTSLSNSIIYLNEHCYLYPSNRHIILYNIDYKCQYLINYENPLDKLDYLSVSSNKEYLAIALNTLNKCRIIIYNINQTRKTPLKRKILSLKQAIYSNHIIYLVFSINSKYLLALYGEPDYILVCWSIQQLKSLAILSLQLNHSHHPLNLQISFNPNDSSQILITGHQIFRQYRLNNGRFYLNDQEEFHRRQSMYINCHCWLNENHILLGLHNGLICTINKHGHIIQQYHMRRIEESNNIINGSFNDLLTHRNVSQINIKNRENISKTVSNYQLSSRLISNKRSSSAINLNQSKQQRRSSSQHSNPTLFDNNRQRQLINRNSIICLLPFSRGVFVSSANGCVFMFERNENSVQLTYLRKLIFSSSSIINDLSFLKTKKNLPRNISIESAENILLSRSSFKSETSIRNEVIHSLALSPNEETLLAATNYNHLYQMAFSKMDYRKKEGNIFVHALDGAHHGCIISGALCIRKPLLFTIGIDRYLKIWNLQTNNQELNHQFDREPLLISVHPSGVLICIAFYDQFSIYEYTIDGLIRFKLFQISNIQYIEYSHQGHMLSLVYDNILQFYHHSNYDQMTSRCIYDNKFRFIRWTCDDAFVISVDVNDLIIRWDPYKSQRLSEYQIANFNVQDLIITSDNKLVYILTTDHKIKEFLLMTSIRDVNIPFVDCIPITLAIDNKTRNLFIGSQNGSIFSLKLTQTNSIIDTNHSVQLNVHQGSVNKILISFSNDLIISMGEDGNLILYNFNDYQLNNESKMSFRDEILAKETLLKQQNIELNYLLKRQIEITDEYENEIDIKENEYIEHLHKLDLHCQSFLDEINVKLTNLQENKIHLQNQHKQQLNDFIREKQNLIDLYIENKTEHYQEISHENQLIKSDIEKFQINQNQQIQSTDHSYQRNIELIHLSYRKKLNSIKNNFFQEHEHINERIDYLEQTEDLSNENAEIELRNVHEYYTKQIRIIVDKIEKFETEEVLLKIRVEQLDEESNLYENQINEYSKQRNQLIDYIRQIENDLNLAEQTFQQRHFLIQEKLKRTNQMENRRDELEKFAYVFNYKIRELTNEIAPRQYEIQGLIDQFNNMDNEYDLLNENNQKYFIKIADYQARLRAIEKDLFKETLLIRKLNETSANIDEDLKLCSHFIDQPKQLTKIIRRIYGKYILHVHTNVSLGEMNIFDCDRQRSYFERTNKRLQTKISIDIKREKMEDIRRIQEQISLMREISSYCLKVVEVERILSDLDIVSNLVTKINTTTSNEIIHSLQLEQGSNFIQQKQIEFNSILNKQQKRIKHLRHLIQRLEQQISDPCQTQLTFQFQSNISIDQSIIMSSKSVHS